MAWTILSASRKVVSGSMTVRSGQKWMRVPPDWLSSRVPRRATAFFTLTSFSLPEKWEKTVRNPSSRMEAIGMRYSLLKAIRALEGSSSRS